MRKLLLIAALALAATAAQAAPTVDYSAKARMETAPLPRPRPEVIDISPVLQQIDADAKAALEDANANQDAIASACYTAISQVAEAKLAANNVPGGGLLTAFQKIRDIARLNASPMGTSLILGCAPLVQDAKINFIQFFTQIGAAVLLKGFLVP